MLKKIILTTALFILTACGFSFQNEQLLPKALQTISLQSYDPYSDMTRILRRQLQARNIKLVDENQSNVPVLRLNQTTMNSEVASVFKQGREAEKILMLRVDATVHLPNQEPRLISAQVNRTFFDNSRAALAKSAEKEVIWQDMYEQAARQLIIKMAAVQHQLN